MANASPRSRVVVGAIARDAAISASIGIAFFFLIFLSRQELWSWRLALYGALGGFAVYAACHSLDAVVGTRIRRWGVVPDRLVGVPLYFVGGSAAFFATTALFRMLRLLPFEMSRRDMRIGLLISGGFAIVVGLLFYSFHLMRERLRQSVERIKEAEFAEKELELARDIQSRLLPPAIVEGEGFRICARNLPARFVAGDFYDVFHLADGNLGLVIADVSGKGIGASLIMASVKAVVPLVAGGRSAADTLTQLNQKLFHELAPREFVALCFARFDAARGTLEIANAGLPDPYRLGTNGGSESLSTPGCRLPLGARADVAYESIRVTLDRGERVLFLTDGLPEAPTAAGEPLGYEALSRLIVSAAAGPEDPLERLFDSVRSATSEALEDDWTALLLERR